MPPARAPSLGAGLTAGTGLFTPAPAPAFPAPSLPAPGWTLLGGW